MTQICIDSIYVGSGYSVHFAGFCDSADNGTVVLSTSIVSGNYGTLCFTYTPNCDTTGAGLSFIGNDTICMVICTTGGADTICTTTQAIITVQPFITGDSIYANDDVDYVCGGASNIDVMNNDEFDPGTFNTQEGPEVHIVSIGAAAGLAPKRGSIVIGSDGIIYDPLPGFAGVDTFKYVIADSLLINYDTATVIVYICQFPAPVAVGDNLGCQDTTTILNTSGIIGVLLNDTLDPALDTILTIAENPLHGKAVVNADRTITYTPEAGFYGNDNLMYSICESSFIITSCDTAFVCLNVINPNGPCIYPNVFSPNGDGLHDLLVFPCNDLYPNASLKIFNRWGDVVYENTGAYKNDWNGTNMQGSALPDATYYYVYQFNDGSGKSEAKFVVIKR
jgi:gliding motility-associated-like protein